MDGKLDGIAGFIFSIIYEMSSFPLTFIFFQDGNPWEMVTHGKWMVNWMMDNDGKTKIP